jgi:hypothetical protein
MIGVDGQDLRGETTMAKTARVKSEESVDVEDDIETSTTQRARPTEEEIAVRAYHIYLERGGAEGNPTDDWLRAERELTEAFDPTVE